MWIVAGLLAAAGICAATEIPSMVGHKKDLWVFSILLALAIALCIAVTQKVPVPNPLDGIAAIFRPIGKLMIRMFE